MHGQFLESLLAKALCMLRNIAFVPAPARTTADPAVAAGAAVLATVPMGADAFVFKGSLFGKDTSLSLNHRCRHLVNHLVGLCFDLVGVIIVWKKPTRRMTHGESRWFLMVLDPDCHH